MCERIPLSGYEEKVITVQGPLGRGWSSAGVGRVGGRGAGVETEMSGGQAEDVLLDEKNSCHAGTGKRADSDHLADTFNQSEVLFMRSTWALRAPYSTMPPGYVVDIRVSNAEPFGRGRGSPGPLDYPVPSNRGGRNSVFGSALEPFEG